VYGRRYGDKELRFEASGGLLNSSLVMQDKETDTYWSLMKGMAVHGELAGTKLQELPGAEKVRWKDWVKKHPDTLVLSVEGVEDPGTDPYAAYWEDPRGFRGQTAADARLPTKEPIYAFRRAGEHYAVPHTALEGGRSFVLADGRAAFLYREKGAPVFASTAAFLDSGGGFAVVKGAWTDLGTGAGFDPSKRVFGSAQVPQLGGFDTYWYTWSLTNPGTRVLR
jgi:hypothetical protein